MLVQLILGVSWLLLSAAVPYYKLFLRPGADADRALLLQKAAPYPGWMLITAITITLPLAPLVACWGWIERRLAR